MQYIRELAEYNGSGRAAVTFGKFRWITQRPSGACDKGP